VRWMRAGGRVAGGRVASGRLAGGGLAVSGGAVSGAGRAKGRVEATTCVSVVGGAGEAKPNVATGSVGFGRAVASGGVLATGEAGEEEVDGAGCAGRRRKTYAPNPARPATPVRVRQPINP
jgi:hypothetical protein